MLSSSHTAYVHINRSASCGAFNIVAHIPFLVALQIYQAGGKHLAGSCIALSKLTMSSLLPKAVLG